MKKSRILYLLLFALAVCGVVYLSIPSERTLVELSRDDDDIARTRQLLERRVDREPGSVDAALELADFHSGRGEIDAAVAVLQGARARFPASAGVQTRLGGELLRRGETDRALATVSEHRRDRDFHYAAAANREQEGDLAQAEAMLLAAGEDTADVWKRVAGWRWDMYETEGAAEALRRALALRPDDRETLEAYFTNRVWALDAAGAIWAAAALETLGPLDRQHLSALHGLQMSVRDIDGAAASLEKLAALPDAGPTDAFALGIFLYAKGDVAQSDEALLALARTPDLPRGILEDALARLELSAVSNRNLDLAMRLADLDAADPRLAESARAVVVDVAMELGRFDEAAAYAAPLAANPQAGVAVLQTALELAYIRDDFGAIPPLHRRLADAGVHVGELLALIPGEDKPLAEWRVRAENPEGRSLALAGLLKTAMFLNARNAETPGTAPATPVAELAETADALLPLIDARAVLTVAAALEALADLADAEPEEAARQTRLEQAAALARPLADTVLAGSAEVMLDAASVNERLGRLDEAERFWRLAARAGEDDPWSRLGLARTAARRGDETTVEDAIRHSEARGDARTAAEIRALVDACLALVDAVREERPDAAERWLARSRELVAANADALSGDDIENLDIRADIAERSGDARAMADAWRRIAQREPGRPDAWLGLARAGILLEQPDAAWEALGRARELLDRADGDEGEARVRVAWQMLAVADATPEDSPRRSERLTAAVLYARETLARTHDDELALSLFWRLLERKELAEAGAYIGSGENAPELNASLAESWLDDGKLGAARERAIAASASTDRDVLLRMAYVLTETGDKDKARELLARVETLPGEETPEYLLQLADAYGGVEAFDRQYALIEKRARAGGEKEWLDAVDRHAWAGDAEGATALLREAGDRYPQSAAILDRTLTLLADNNRPGEVLDVFRKAVNAIDGVEGKLSADALAALGVASDDVRQTPRARRFFRLSFEKDAANKRGCMGYARLLRRDGNLAGALAQLRRYAEGTPDDPWGWLEVANTRSLADQNGRSEYREVVRLTEPDEKGDIARDVRAARAVALRALGREKEALALLRGTMGPRIDNPDIACDFAQMLMEIRQYDEAEAILRETVKAFPYHVWAYRLESTILVRRQKYDLAVERLREALLWSPHDGEVQRDLGFAAQLWERTWDAQKGWLTAGGR